MPVIASFAIGGTASPKRSPLDAGSNIDCGPNLVFDQGSNTCVAIDDGSNTGTGGGGVGSGGLPATK